MIATLIHTDYINKKTLVNLINENEGLPFWMQSLVMKLYWSFQKNGETWMTLSECWSYLWRVYRNRFNPEQLPQEGPDDYIPFEKRENVKQYIIV